MKKKLFLKKKFILEKKNFEKSFFQNSFYSNLKFRCWKLLRKNISKKIKKTIVVCFSKLSKSKNFVFKK